MSAAHQHLTPSPWVLQQALAWPDGGRVLDFACGRGRHSIALATRFDMLAVDRNAAALAKFAAHPNITVCQCDLESAAVWPFADTVFDAVIVTNYLFRAKLPALFDLVVAGGYLAYETFAVGNAAYGRPTNPDFLLHEGELVASLPADFVVIDSFHGTVTTPQPAMIQRLAARRKSAPAAPQSRPA
jgi:SAM-dependent methyltransferase